MTSRLLFLCCLTAPAFGGTRLFDFETPDELTACHPERAAAGTPVPGLALSDRLATSGKASLAWSSPQWREGLARWPAFEVSPPVRDWSGYDRLFFEVTNPTAHVQRLNLFITDSTIATRSGLQSQNVLQPYSYNAVVVPLAGLKSHKVDPKDIDHLHFYTADVPGDMVLYIDRVTLLAKDEPTPAVPERYLREFAGLLEPRVQQLQAGLTEALERLSQQAAAEPATQAWIATEVKAIAIRIDEFRQLAQAADPAVLDAQRQVDAIDNLLGRLDSLVALRVGFEPVRSKVQRSGFGDGTAVGMADSMVKVLPRDVPVEVAPARRIDVALARNERESVQLVVVPLERDLKQVEVKVDALAGPGGASFPADAVQAVPVGYVETKTVPPYGSSHVGWWPDPILDFMTAADIAKGDAQAFWVRFAAPKEQPAGNYSGTLRVTVGGQTAFEFDLGLTVYPFTLPNGSPMPLAITFAPHDHPTAETLPAQTEWRKEDDYPINAWKRHKLEWAEFLADYRLTYDSLYHRGVPDFDILEQLQREGRLGMFNLGYYGPMGAKPDDEAKWVADTIPRLREGYDEAKKRGLLDHAYIYGCDEAPADLFPTVERAAARLKQEFPGVLIMTTTYDHTFGKDTVIKSVDAWCPLTPKMDVGAADLVREQGRQVWWYICCGPHHPHANMFIEYPAIEGRLLMGPLATRFRPDGFLYYQISIWNSRRPITSGPFTDWDPRSWTTYHGDGSWTDVGPDGTPLATIRLENFRDGLEDYAYARILEATIAKVEADPQLSAARQAWLAKAKELVAVPEELVAGITEWSRDPLVLRQWRSDLAAAIAQAGIPPVEP